MAQGITGAVGFVGLGNIGKPMAERLLAWPGGLLVCDLAREPLAELEANGATIARDVSELAGRVDLLCVMVRDDEQVRSVVAEALPAAREGLVIAIHSTVSPDTPQQLQDSAQNAAVSILDAPVSGGAMGASGGQLAILIGGESGAFDAARDALSLMGSKIVFAGPLGAGTRMKLARNMMHYVAYAAATEAQRLAEAAGLDLVALGDVVRHTDAVTGGPGAIMHRESTAPLKPGEFWYGAFEPLRVLAEKDLGFALELADSLGVEVPLARQALERLGPGLGLP